MEPREIELVAGVLLGISAIWIAVAFLVASKRQGKSDRDSMRATIIPAILAAICVITLFVV